MGLSLRNVEKGLERKIKRCIALLDDEYQTLNFTIYFYENREKLERERLNKPDMKEEHYEQILNGINETAGITIGDKGRIKIFLFLFGNVKRNPQEIINLIGNVYHEIRHAWQFENNLYQDEEEIPKIDGIVESYYALPSEKDAYQFQEKQMQKHGEEILKIFGFNLDGKVYKYELHEDIRKVIYS